MLVFATAGLTEEASRPNVVVFLVDDLGPDELVCYASRFHETPNIDALAERGMRFTRAYSLAVDPMLPVGSKRFAVDLPLTWNPIGQV